MRSSIILYVCPYCNPSFCIIFLSFWLLFCLYVYLSVYQTHTYIMYISLCTYICQSLSVLSVCRFLSLSICVFFCICMFVRILVFHYVYSLHLSFIMYTYFYLIVNMYASLMYVSVYTSPCVCMFLCVCIYLSHSICSTCFVNHYIFLYL